MRSAAQFIEQFSATSIKEWTTRRESIDARQNAWQMAGSYHNARDLASLFGFIGAHPMKVAGKIDERYQQQYARDRVIAALRDIELVEERLRLEGEQLAFEFIQICELWGLDVVLPD